MAEESNGGLIKRLGQSNVAAGYSRVSTTMVMPVVLVLLAAGLTGMGWIFRDEFVTVRDDAIMAKAAALALEARVGVLETVTKNHVDADIEVRRTINDRIGRIESKLDAAAATAADMRQQIAVLSSRFDGLLIQLRRQADAH